MCRDAQPFSDLPGGFDFALMPLAITEAERVERKALILRDGCYCCRVEPAAQKYYGVGMSHTGQVRLGRRAVPGAFEFVLACLSETFERLGSHVFLAVDHPCRVALHAGLIAD